MMEITLGLLASCLPTLRGLFKTHSMDSVVKNVRSIFSLRSRSSSSKIGYSENSGAKRSGSLNRDTEIEVSVQSKASHEREQRWV